MQSFYDFSGQQYVHRLMAHFKSEKVISLQLENVKYAWTTPVQAPLITPAGGRGRLGGEGKPLNGAKGA